MLDAKISDLGTPAKEQGRQGEHCGNVPDAYVCHVDASIQREFLQLVEVAGDVLERRVSDPRTPREVERAEFAQILGDEFHSVVCDFAAPAQA